jgi:hypothetical protein
LRLPTFTLLLTLEVLHLLLLYLLLTTMSDPPIHHFMRDKRIKAAVTILSAAVVSPVAAGILSAVFTLSAISLSLLTTLLRPSKWPRLSAWPCWTWGAIILVVVSLLVAWFFPAPEILTCAPLGDLFCVEWWPPLVPAGVYLLLVWFDYLHHKDFCDAGTEVRITRIAECGRRGYSLIIHSNTELSIWQRSLIRIKYGWRCFKCPSRTVCFAGVAFHLCLLSVEFNAERDGTRTRRVSRWLTPERRNPIRFSYRRMFLERVDRYLSEFPLAIGLVLYAIHGVFLWFGLYQPMLFGALVVWTGLAWLGAWLMLGRLVDPCLDCWISLALKMDAFIDGFYEIVWAFLTNESIWAFIVACKISAMIITGAGLFVYFFCEVGPIPSCVHLAISCVLLYLLALVPVVGRPLKCAACCLSSGMLSFARWASSAALACVAEASARAAAPARVTVSAVALAANAALKCAMRVLLVVFVAFRCRRVVLCVYSSTTSVSRSSFCLFVSPLRQSSIVPARDLRLKYCRPCLTPLDETASEGESSLEDFTPVPSDAAGAPLAKEEQADSVHVGHCEETAVLKQVPKKNAVLRTMASAVVPVRNSLRFVRRVAAILPRR